MDEQHAAASDEFERATVSNGMNAPSGSSPSSSGGVTITKPGTTPCPLCKGTGTIRGGNVQCPQCKGTGLVPIGQGKGQPPIAAGGSAQGNALDVPAELRAPITMQRMREQGE